MSEVAIGGVLDVLVDHRGKTPKKLGTAFVTSGVPVISAVSVKSGRLILDRDQRCVSYEAYSRWMPIPLRRGDVLLTSEAPLGEVARVPTDDPLVLGQRLFGLRGREGVLDNGYLFYALQWEPVRQRMFARSTGTTVHGIRQSELVQVRIPLPPFEEQRGIAEVLGALDDKIEANARIASMSEELATASALMVTNTTTIGSMARNHRNQVSPAAYPDSRLDHFSLPAFDSGRMPSREPAESIRSSKFLIDRPMVLVSKLNPHIHRVWLAGPLAGRTAVASTEFVCLTPSLDYPIEVLWAICNSDGLNRRLQEMAKGTTGSHQRVSPDDVLSAEVPDPMLLPEVLVQLVVSNVQLAAALRHESESLSALRDALLPRFMSRELRVEPGPQVGTT